MTPMITDLHAQLRTQLIRAGIHTTPETVESTLRDLLLCLTSCSSSDDPAIYATHCQACRQDARRMAEIEASR